MNKLRNYLFYFICISSIVYLTLSGYKVSANGTKHIHPTYLDSPKHYFLKIDSLPIDEWKNVTDTLGGIFGVLGKSLSVDQSEYFKAAAIRQLQTIGKRISLDSTHMKYKK